WSSDVCSSELSRPPFGPARPSAAPPARSGGAPARREVSMNEEQRAVLAAVARLEESRGGPIDEYTVARASGLLDTDLPGQDWMLRPEREAIRRLFDELEQQGMLRLDRTGYWRPRTTLAGRRALQTPSAAPFPHRGAVPVEDESLLASEPVRGEARAWPAWWPAALRFGGPYSAP